MTYKQAYDLIIEAYFRNEIQPYRGEFCFCGTLADADASWQGLENYQTLNGYNRIEFFVMERCLLATLRKQTIGGDVSGDNIYAIFDGSDDEKLRKQIQKHPNYENALFNGMYDALCALKQIHLERGEIIDEPIETFKKRELSQSKPMQPTTI